MEYCAICDKPLRANQEWTFGGFIIDKNKGEIVVYSEECDDVEIKFLGAHYTCWKKAIKEQLVMEQVKKMGV